MSVNVLEECKTRLRIDEQIVATLSEYIPSIDNMSEGTAITLIEGTFDAALAKVLVDIPEGQLQSSDMPELNFRLEIQHDEGFLAVNGSADYRVALKQRKATKKNVDRTIRYWARKSATDYLSEVGSGYSVQKLERLNRRIASVLTKLLLDNRISQEVIEKARSIRLTEVS